MDEPENDAQRELLYREYVRLGEIGNGYVKDALSDIKLLGGVGAVLDRDPIARLLLFYDLFKQSIFFFHLSRMHRLERRLNELYPGKEPLFDIAGARPRWQRKVHDRVALPTFLVFYLIVIGFPSVLMYYQGFHDWILFSILWASALIVTHFVTAWHVIRSLERC